MDELPTHRVRVTNGMDRTFSDRFDGIPIIIEPGKRVELSVEQAAHLFGWHVDANKETMLRHTAKRQGWNTIEHLKPDPVSRKTLAETDFDKLKIEPIRYRMVEEDKAPPEKADTKAATKADPALRDDDEDDKAAPAVGEAEPPTRAGRFKRPSAVKRED